MSDENAHMQRAVELARNCSPEDQAPRPHVGVVVVPVDGDSIEAFRGEIGPGEHAEFTALERKGQSAELAGATVYTTLEPCTTRNHPKRPCAQWLIERKVKRVVIGSLDPNPNILGRGVLQLRQANVEVAFFPPGLMASLEELNREFAGQFAHALAPPLTDQLLKELEGRPLDAWYRDLNRIYWNRNFQRSAADIFMHLVEVIGNLSVTVTKKHKEADHGRRLADVQRYLAKSVAWWLALCGKLGIRSVEDLIFGKFPYECPYCRQTPHSGERCKRGGNQRGPDWAGLAKRATENRSKMPRSIAQWQQMFSLIYETNINEEYAGVFAKLTEEVGELAESVRVFSAEPGYFLSEAADVFAWLMKLNNLLEFKEHVPLDNRGLALERTFSRAYPSRCLDCHSALCTCPPILPSTVGRIAHEVSAERSTYEMGGSFLTPDKMAAEFGPGS